MGTIEFQWDKKKASSNQNKHGVSFDEAKTVFYDESAIIISDPDHSEHEERFVIIGRSSLAKVLIVCHCYREPESIIRIISAGKATKRETKQYRGY